MKYQTNASLGLTLIALLFILLLSNGPPVSSAHGRVTPQVGGDNNTAVPGEHPDSLGQWTRHGPYGGLVSSVAIDGNSPLTVYAGTPAGVFRSTDGGANWAISLTNTPVQIVAIARTTPTTVYAAGQGVYKSIDGGVSWNAVNNGLQDQFGPINILALTIDPTNSNIVYAAGPDITEFCCFKAIYKSTDGGGSWSIVKHSINSYAVHHVLAFDPTNPKTVYAAGSVGNGTVWKSIDEGKLWSIANVGLDSGSTVHSLVVDPSNPSIIYVGTELLGVYKSSDGGANWSAFNDGLPYSYTDNSGLHYFSRVSSVRIDPLDPNLLYAGTYGGVFKSNDGASWTPLNGGLTNLGVESLATDPANPNTFYSGTTNGIFKTTDGGAHWSTTNNGLHNVNVAAVTIAPSNAALLYARTPIFDSNIPYASANGGDSWAVSGFYPLAFDPHNANTLYALLLPNYELNKSTDGGATWGLADAGMQKASVLEVLVDPNNSNLLYAGAYNGVFKSTDAGASWDLLNTQFFPLALVMDPKNPQVFYAFTSYDDCFTVTYPTFKSIDGGVTWANGPDFYFLSSLAIDPVNTTTVYLAGCRAEGCGIFRSDNGGSDWSLVSTGLPASGASALVIDPTKPNLLYAGTEDSGVFMSTDKGATWSSLNNGLTNFSVNALAIDSTGNFLHAGTQGGVFDYQFNLVCSYATSAASQTFPAIGGSGSVSVTAPGGCNWQATSNPAWITINPPSGGSGDGTVNLSVAANSSPFPRTAVLNLAGQTFTVNQFGGQPINTIDGTQSFVQQHYGDFLNRASDPAGLNFWNDNINSCGFDPQCFEVKRIDTSAAFFLSIEFQQTGYLVYRTYKAAYGNLPNTPVPLRFNEFLPDTMQIGQGVIVNQTGWEQLLESNKLSFFADFVQRSRFTSLYPISLAPDQFVDQLFLNAGVTPATTDRAAAINEFGASMTTSDVAARARAFRRVAESSALSAQEFNRGFVLMQYFGYLRRNPSDPPEPTLDFQGYNFWLAKLNQFNGNFRNAEMVKAFLVSTEYRQRFGQP